MVSPTHGPKLRGLPLVECKLRVTPPVRDGVSAEAIAKRARVFTFTPAAQEPTEIWIDLSQIDEVAANVRATSAA